MDGVIVTNALHEIVWANQAFLDMTGYNIDEIIGKLPSFMRSFRHNQAYYDAFEQKLKNDGSWQGEIWNKHKKGTIHPFWMQSFLIKDEITNFTRFVAVYKDLEKAELFNQKILLMMQRDPLTYVYNRTFFVEKVEHILQTFHMQAHTVVFLDLDNFKIYNDKNGHMLGDSLLSAFASRLLHFFNNETVGRYGGDEFVILFKNQDDKLHISDMMDQLNKQLKEEPIVIRDAKYQLSVSYGISTYPKDGENISVLIDNADKKMYLNKNKNV
ncbi:MAG: sensor domain-containing diguanylate cyclase, partial [Acholeplasmataceae bacterium]|nr:sensor domain-containing diguanylate cyclase [Acholeplasmataceae bacterium]